MQECDVRFADLQKERGRIGLHSKETIDRLYDFGLVLTNEVQQRAAQIDTKLGIYLAASIGIIALLSIAIPKNQGSPGGRVAAIIALLLAAIAGVLSANGLRSSLWPFPSETAWFNENEIKDEDRLKRTYVLGLLQSHQLQQRKVCLKVNQLVTIEVFLQLSALAMTVLIFTRL